MSTRPGRGQARGTFLRASLVGGVVALLAAAAAGAAPSSGGQAPTKITVSVIAADATAQVLYAKDRGFFRRHGLDVEVQILADGTQTVPALLSGQAQFGAIPTAALAVAKSNNLPLKAVAGGAVYQPGTRTTVLVAAPGRQIRRARDLRGKRIGLDFVGSVADIALRRWLQRGGVSRDDVEVVGGGGFPPLMGPLLRGQLDAAWLPEPFATQAYRRGARHVANPFDATCSADCLVTVFTARTNVDPGLAARFRVAVQEAGVWANQKRNHPASARILSRYTRVATALIEQTTRIRYATRLRVRMAQPFLDLYAEYDLIPDTFRATDLVR
jgi:NitT/TauT family transport system substrate-binding protein